MAWRPHHVAQALAFVAIPWLVKPLYGLISDFIPLLGYRRKTYLVLVTSLSTFGYLVVSQLTAPPTILTILLITTLGIAAMDVLVDALMVEEGQKTGLIGQFQGQQWTWLNLASITAAALGGGLIKSINTGRRRAVGGAAYRLRASRRLGEHAALD